MKHLRLTNVEIKKKEKKNQRKKTDDVYFGFENVYLDIYTCFL